MEPLFNETKQRMRKVLDVIRNDLATVRTGKASPSLVDNISVSVYSGSARMRIVELATVSTPDTQTLLIAPFDASILGEIQKGIMEANVGLTPTNDGQVIRISLPPLSQERREQLIHLMKQKLENGRIMIRQARQEAMQEIKKDDDLSEDDEKRYEKEVQKVTDDFMNEIDSIGKQKEQELLQI